MRPSGCPPLKQHWVPSVVEQTAPLGQSALLVQGVPGWPHAAYTHTAVFSVVALHRQDAPPVRGHETSVTHDGKPQVDVMQVPRTHSWPAWQQVWVPVVWSVQTWLAGQHAGQRRRQSSR